MERGEATGRAAPAAARIESALISAVIKPAQMTGFGTQVGGLVRQHTKALQHQLGGIANRAIAVDSAETAAAARIGLYGNRLQLFSESRYSANAPAFSKEGFFFSCPMAFCAFRYVCHFFVAALCAACIRAMLSGFLNISHRREWMSRSLWTRSRVFRAACSVREQINALQISGRTGYTSQRFVSSLRNGQVRSTLSIAAPAGSRCSFSWCFLA